MSLLTENVLVRPVSTEKSVAQTGKYTFVVHQDANKSDVKIAVKEFYGLDVVSVNMINLGLKTKTAGRGMAVRRRAPQRKAIVTLKEGETLEFNDFK